MITVVIPIYNEEQTLPELYSRLTSVLDGVGEDYEIVFVDDGSRDSSWEKIREMNRKDGRIKALSFSRNFGHQTAVSAGMMFSSGDAVVLMDGDLQDPPEIIPDFVDAWKQGNEVVYAIRTKRKESLFKKASYYIFYRLLRKMANIKIPLDSGDFCLMDKKVVQTINALPERARFVRGLRSWAGFKQIGIQFERGKRHAGEPKYTFIKLLKLAFDGMVSFSNVPLKMTMFAGFAVSGVSLLFSLYVIINYILGTKLYFISENPGWASLIVSITFLGGIQLIAVGILGEYLGRVFDEVKQRPHFVVREYLGLQGDRNHGNP
jgi:dolichol-phosphate mannosyltransferase